MTSSLLSVLLAKYDLTESELETHYAGANALVQSSSSNEATLARLVRVVATNKALTQRGLPPLLQQNNKQDAVASKAEEAEEAAAEDDVCDELTDTEKRMLGEYGGGGLVLGIAVGYPFYWRCKAKCRSKRARKLSAQDPKAFQRFILRFLKALAKEELRRDALGLRRVTPQKQAEAPQNGAMA
jgi:hypothetical protein